MLQDKTELVFKYLTLNNKCRSQLYPFFKGIYVDIAAIKFILSSRASGRWVAHTCALNLLYFTISSLGDLLYK